MTQIRTSEQIAFARALLEEYALWLTIDVPFQEFVEELGGIPGVCSPPQGRFLLAHVNEQAVGCVALRPISGGVCEMKRLFVRPAFRNQGIGRLLAVRIIVEAKAMGYTTAATLITTDTIGDRCKRRFLWSFAYKHAS